MKIVPFFYKNAELKAERKIVQNKDEIVQNKGVEDNSAKSLDGKLELNNVFRQDSSARFMKINTDMMEEEGIFKNDIVVIDPLGVCVNGKIVVAMVNNSVMIRRYEKIKSGYVLYGDSKKISPLKIEEGYDQFKILGVVVYVIKSL